MLDRITQLQQENDRLQAELAQLRQENDRLRQSEARSCQTPLLSTVATVANLLLRSPDYNTVLPDVVRLLGEAVGSDRCEIFRYDSKSRIEESTMQFLAEWCKETVPQSTEIDFDLSLGFPCNAAIQFYEKNSVGEVANFLVVDLQEPAKSIFQAQGSTSIVSVPIIIANQFWGAITFDNCGEPRLYDEAEIAILQVAAESLAAAIARQAKDEELRESEERFRTLFELSSEGFYYSEIVPPCPVSLPIEKQCELLYQNIRVVKANPAFAAMYGAQHPDELIGLTNADVHVAGLQKNAAFIQGIVENGYRFCNLETEEIDRQGRLHYFLNSGVCTIRDGYAVSAWSTRVDITQLRETQQALLEAERARVAELAKTNQALKNSLDRLAAEPDLNAFLGHVTLEAVAQLGANAAHIMLFDEQQEIFSTTVLVEKGRVVPASMLAAELSVEQVRLHSVMQRVRHLRYFDLETEEHLFWDGSLEYHRQQNHRSVLVVPLNAGDKFLGYFGLAFTAAEPLPEQGIELLQALAHQAALAIQLTRLADEAKQAAIAREQEKAAQERAAELTKVNEVLRRTASQLVGQQDLNHFLNNLLLEIAQELEASNNSIFLCDHTSNSYRMHYSVQDGQVVNLETDPRFEFWQTLTSADNDGWRLIQSRGYMWSVLDIDATQYDQLCDWTIEWHRQMQHRAVMCFLLQMGDKPLGFMGLCFREAIEPSADRIGFIQTLTNQAALAIQLTKLAEEAKQAAIAREQEKAAQERAAELTKANEALRRTANRLASEPQLESFLGHVLLEACTQLDASAGHLTIYNVDRHSLTTAAHVYDGQILPVDFPEKFQLDFYCFFDLLVETGEPRAFNFETEAHLFWPGTVEYHRARGHIYTFGIPILLDNQPYGHIGLGFTRPNDLVEEQCELLRALSNQAALAIQLTRLADEAKQAAIAREQEIAAQQRAAQLAKANEALKRSLTMLALEPSLDKLLGYVLQAISDQLGDRSGAVYLFDDSDDTTLMHLNYEDGQLQQGEQINHPATTLHRPPQEWDTQYLPLLRQNQVLIHHEAEFASPAYDPYRQHNTQRRIKTLLFVPLLFGEQLLGSITLRSTQHRDYTPEELELARALAHQATLAIQLTRLAAQNCDRAILEERNRMARDIHDSLAQAFTGIILQLEAAKRKIAATQPEAAQNCLSRARSLAASGLSEARRSVRALRPEALESDDLPSALDYIVEQMSWNTDVKITLQIDGTPRPIPVDVEINLLRIGQEALTNALRHADAQNIRLNLLFEPEAVHLQIRDDGQGFEPQVQLTNGGFGLIGMQERSRQIGGQLRLVSSIGRGTEAIVTVPT